MLYIKLRKKISEYLLYFFPTSLVLGPFIGEIVMNLIVILFLVELYKRNISFYLSKFFFYIPVAFFFYLVLNAFISEYRNEIIIKIIFIFRFILFAFAVTNIFINNINSIKYFFKYLALLLLLVTLDSYIQFFFSENILGYKSYRPDRISGFFKEKLVLGSFLYKFLIVYIILFNLLFKKIKKKNLYFYFLIIPISFIGIVISGDRSPIFLFIIFTVLFLVFSNLKFYLKLFSLSIFIFSLVSILIFSDKIYDRVVRQSVDQIFSKFEIRNTSFFKILDLKNYNTLYTTAYKAFIDKKTFGHGPNTYRYFCSNVKYRTYSENFFNPPREILFQYNIKTEAVKIKKIHIVQGQNIKEGDPIISYVKQSFFTNKKIYTYYSDREGTIDAVVREEGNSIYSGYIIAKISNDNSINIQSKRIDGCTTHPHNYYLQLLAETGLVGFLSLLIIFFYFILKILISPFLKSKSNFNISLYCSFVVIFFPFVPHGNFFNNWVIMSQIIPISLYLYALSKK